MTIDMSQFYEVFFEESAELLGEMERLLLELKAAEAVSPLHRAQVITYLKLLKLPLGLLINFNSLLLKDGLERILNVPRRHP